MRGVVSKQPFDKHLVRRAEVSLRISERLPFVVHQFWFDDTIHVGLRLPHELGEFGYSIGHSPSLSVKAETTGLREREADVKTWSQIALLIVICSSPLL